MTTFSTTIKLKGNLAKANKKVFMDVHREAITEQMQRAVDVTYMSVKEHIPKGASNLLYNSVNKKVTNFPSFVEGKVYIKEGLAQRYAKPVEFGRKAGAKWPPKGALILWLIVKLGMSYREAKQKEWFFRRSIAKKGIKPVLMFFTGYHEASSYVNSIFENTGKVIKEKLANARK